MSRFYLLDENKKLVPTDLMTWAREFADDNKRIVRSDVIAGCHVSTVFLGLDHGFTNEGVPIVFETMTFEGPIEQQQERYSTWDEAVAGHDAMCAKVRAALT